MISIWGISRFNIFGNLTYSQKITVLRHFSPTPPYVRDIGPPRSNCCDDKSISLREGVTLTHCSEAVGCQPAVETHEQEAEGVPCCSVLGKQIAYNADTVSSGRKL